MTSVCQGLSSLAPDPGNEVGMGLLTISVNVLFYFHSQLLLSGHYCVVCSIVNERVLDQMNSHFFLRFY